MGYKIIIEIPFCRKILIYSLFGLKSVHNHITICLKNKLFLIANSTLMVVKLIIIYWNSEVNYGPLSWFIYPNVHQMVNPFSAYSRVLKRNKSINKFRVNVVKNIHILWSLFYVVTLHYFNVNEYMYHKGSCFVLTMEFVQWRRILANKYCQYSSDVYYSTVNNWLIELITFVIFNPFYFDMKNFKSITL